MREGYSQSGTTIKVKTSLGKDFFILDSFSGNEYLSGLFHFQLNLRSESTFVDPKIIVNTELSISIFSADEPSRFFSGVVSAFRQKGIDSQFAYYEADVTPDLWLLTLTTNRLIFQNLSAVEIISGILESNGIAYENRLTKAYKKREYCVQYDETTFNFICRLMEEEGIFYFFNFSESGSTVVLGDSSDCHKDCLGYALVYRAEKAERSENNTVSKFETSGKLITANLDLRDYNYLTPNLKISSFKSSGFGVGEKYQYPAKALDLNESEFLSTVRSEEISSDFLSNYGESVCPELSAGSTFSLTGYSNPVVNRRYVLKKVFHEAKDNSYKNSFDAFPEESIFRPPYIAQRPSVSGSQSAIVVGPPGEEIWTDNLGRIKVKFFWDRSNSNDQNSSCWIRVSQTWADTGWGSLFIPRIGQEVIVTYIDGDPDRPVVTGCLYNAERDRPVELPANQTQSVIRTRPFSKPPDTNSGNSDFVTDVSSLISSADEMANNIITTQKSSQDLFGTFIQIGDDEPRSDRGVGNEIRFEDKTENEELYLHAHKNMKVDIENDFTTKVYFGSELHQIKNGDLNTEILKGNETHLVEKDRELTINGEEKHINTKNFVHEIDGNYECKVKGDYTLIVDGDLKIAVKGKVSIEADDQINIVTKKNFKAESSLGFEIKSDYTVGIEASLSMEMKSLSLDIKNSVSTAITAGASMKLKAGAAIALAAPAVKLGA